MRTVSGSMASDGILDPDGATEYLKRWKGRIDQMAADTQAMSDRLGQLRVSADDGDGLVEVTIDSTGMLIDVQFAQRIQRVAPDVVSRAVLRAMQQAKLKAAQRSQQIIAETMGPDSVAARAIAERVTQQLQPPAGDPPVPGVAG
ncbi:YbaB/EbfC family nucleoid-associated protein [Couchioplanes azureus]|uniref:YbaB/EbfC family nucleoid-associated protein n=1 Tax=Couchioplanes caeruleus TaxID=56438 RepID=UPI001E5B6FF3|nr:YbaB/EbfC family nucleoid-associated protein [Couchioplanes caeruleus]